MRSSNQQGNLNVLVLPLIALGVLFIAATAFAIWAYSSRQDYKNNVDQKISAANQKVKQQTQTEDQAKYFEESQRPNIAFQASETFGSLSFQHSKTWSTYINDQGATSNSLDVYLNPNAVLPINAQSSSSALRVKVVSQPYDSVIRQYANNQKVTVSAYKLPKVTSVVGSRVDGQVQPNKQGSMVVLPLRDKTLEIWTESNTYLNEFNNVILPSVTFVP